MLDFTFLKKDQIWGDDALDVMKRYGTKVAPTDLTTILGGMTCFDERTSENTCYSWSASEDDSWMCDVLSVSMDGDEDGSSSDSLYISARPSLPSSEAAKISPKEVGTINRIRVVEWGEYPQMVADEPTSEKLERLHGSRSLHPTGKNYTLHSVDKRSPIKLKPHSEYELDGKRYIRVPGAPCSENSRLSTGEQVEDGKPYWVEVQPIEWLMDKSGWMIAKKCLFAGIPIYPLAWGKHEPGTSYSYGGDFLHTFMKHYLDMYFAKEIMPLELEKSQKKTKTTKAHNIKVDGREDALAVKAKELDNATAEISSLPQLLEKISKEGRLNLTKKGNHDLFQKLHDIEHRARAKANLRLYKQKKDQQR